MKIIALSESPLKVRKIVVYRSLISFLVPELRFKDLKNYQKMVRKMRSWIKSIKIDKICDDMWWTPDFKQSLIILCLGKYLPESFETLKAKTTRHYAKRYLEKIGCHGDDVGPRPLQ